MDIEQSDLDDAVQQMQSYLEGMEVRQGGSIYQLAQGVGDVGLTASTVLIVVTLIWARVPFHWWYVLVWVAFVVVRELRQRSV